MTHTVPAISVVIPTHNRRASLLRLLGGLARGTLPPDRFEVIAVADGCSDDTLEALRGETFPFAFQALEVMPGRGPATARNMGARVARAPILLFLDDDIEPLPGLLEAHLREHRATPAIPRQRSESVVIGAPLPVRLPGFDLHRSAIWGWWDQQFEKMELPGHRFRYDEVFGAILSLPRALFHAAGEFDESFNGCREDPELGLRLIRHGVRIAFSRAGGGYHHEVRNRSQMLARKRAEGVADVQLAEVYPDVWPSLQLAHHRGGSRWLRFVRAVAFQTPTFGGLMLWVGVPVLALLQRVRFRRSWWAIHGGSMYYSYWRGVADRLGGGDRAKARLAELGRIAGLGSAAPIHECDLDLEAGLPEAEAVLDRERPARARVWLGELEIGTLPALPGGELLAGRHLRRSLWDSLAWPARTALAFRYLAGRRAPPLYSIVMPAFNAADTLGRALDSVLAQSEARWELVVVDDGSSDETAELAARYAAADSRIRLIRQRRGGPAAARNTAIDATTGDWLLFLDADDWIDPSMLERMGEALTADPGLDAVLCGWEIVDTEGQVIEQGRCQETGDLFPGLAKRRLFPIHACVVRRCWVTQAGGFPSNMGHSEDWMFWQRVARLGARFGAVPDYLVSYRRRPGSRSADAFALFDYAEQVIRIGHGNDPGLPDSVRAGSGSPADIEKAWLEYLYWAATTMIIVGEDPTVLIYRKGPIDVPLELWSVAEELFAPLALHLKRVSPEARSAFCRAAWDRFENFLVQLAGAAGVPGLDRSVLIRLDRRLAETGLLDRPYHLGLTTAIEIDLTKPLEDFPLDAGAERLLATISIGAARLGTIELPVCEATVPAWLLADVISDHCAWQILGHFFERGLYQSIQWVEDSDGTVSATLDVRKLATGLPPDPRARLQAFHDRCGWELFVEELWNPETGGSLAAANGPDPVIVEVSDPVYTLGSTGAMTIEVRVGGWPVGLVEVAGPLDAASLRTRLTDALGYELCRVAVREVIIGRSFTEGGSLRERLAAAAGARNTPESRASSGGQAIALAEALGAEPDGIALGRRPGRVWGTAAERRALLPVACADDMAPLEASHGTPARTFGAGRPARLAYVPEFGNRAAAYGGTEPGSAGVVEPFQGSLRFDFEATFAKGADPWGYGSDYEQLKYQQTLDLLPPRAFDRALELACAEGHFTVVLADRVSHLMATDLSRIALARAGERCRGRENVEFRLLDLRRDSYPDDFDLVVCSEVLYYLADESELREVVAKLAGALAPGGCLVTAHPRTAVDEPDHTGFDWTVPFGSATIHRVLGETVGLRLVSVFETPLYRIALHTTDSAADAPPAQIIVSDQYAQPRPEIAARIRWKSGIPPAVATSRVITSSRLPILMYHRIAPFGVADRSRYRVTPASFEQQLEFLRDCGFRSITLEQWRDAAATKRPMSGRPIILTFDDGFVDFEEHAWPRLQRFGFGALVNLVTGSIGRWNEWDVLGTEEPLMDWTAVARLHADGVEFGAHGMTHAASTRLSATELVREAIGSRVALEQKLGIPVPAFAYPYGDHDAAVRHLIGGCGFGYGLTADPGWASLTTPLLALPRIEISGDLDLAGFIARLADGFPAA